MHSMLPLSPHPSACHPPLILSPVKSRMLPSSPVRSAVFQGADVQAISLLSVDMPPRRASHAITTLSMLLQATLDGVTSPTLQASKRRSSTTTLTHFRCAFVERDDPYENLTEMLEPLKSRLCRSVRSPTK